MENKIIHPDFDGHPEKPLKDMTPKEKLQYLSDYVDFYYSLRKKAKKVDKGHIDN